MGALHSWSNIFPEDNTDVLFLDQLKGKRGPLFLPLSLPLFLASFLYLTHSSLYLFLPPSLPPALPSALPFFFLQGLSQDPHDYARVTIQAGVMQSELADWADSKERGMSPPS